METIARSFNVSRDALIYRSTQLEVCFWNEKDQFASPFQNIEPGETRVTDIAAQIPAQFLETAMAVHLRRKDSPAPLADWVFTSEQLVETYLGDLQRVGEV